MRTVSRSFDARPSAGALPSTHVSRPHGELYIARNIINYARRLDNKAHAARVCAPIVARDDTFPDEPWRRRTRGIN